MTGGKIQPEKKPWFIYAGKGLFVILWIRRNTFCTEPYSITIRKHEYTSFYTQQHRIRVRDRLERGNVITEHYRGNIYEPRPMARELRNEDVWRQCGFERFITDFASVTKDVFTELVHELAEKFSLGKPF